MRKQVLNLVFLMFAAVPNATAQTSGNDPHQQAYQCRLNLDNYCNGVCLQCHLPPDGELDIYAEGDIALCGKCHDKEAVPAEMGRGLLSTHGGNHPSQVDYNADSSKQYNDNPAGPKLFCDASGGNCKVLCSTCHAPHSGSLAHLRMNNRGSALCLSCHRK